MTTYLSLYKQEAAFKAHPPKSRFPAEDFAAYTIYSKSQALHQVHTHPGPRGNEEADSEACV